MIRICLPDEADTRAIQARERAFYWSRCAEIVLRKHGLVACADSCRESRAADCTIILRGHRPPALLPNSAVLEGPLSPTWLADLGLSAETYTCPELECHDVDQRFIGTLLYSTVAVRSRPRTRDEQAEAHEHVDRDPRWHSRPVTVQCFAPPPPWKPIAFGRIGGRLRPVALSDGRRMLFGMPIFDVLTFNHAMPALTEGFHASLRAVDQVGLERWLVRLIVECAQAAGRVPVERPIWPGGRRAALSIRLDYDRPISDARLREILRFHAARDIRATWYLLVHKPPPRTQIAEMIHRGHEVALHSAAWSREEFLDETSRFTALTGVEPAGFTCHGGVGSSGHLALTHSRWAVDAGMLYGEMLGRPRGVPTPLLDPAGDRPAIRPFVLQNVHYSLDRSTKPNDHWLDALSEQVPVALNRGLHVIVMNHPDIHWAEMRALLEPLDLRDVWCCTCAEAARWFAETKYAAT